MKPRQSTWALAGALLIFFCGQRLPVLAQGVICCNQLIDVGGDWIGASRHCDLSNVPPDRRASLCKQLAGCPQAAQYCGGDVGGVDGSCTVGGSLVDIQNQALGETIRIIGTPFSLNYRSDRFQGVRSNSPPNSLGGWTLDGHYAYDGARKILHTGKGRPRVVESPVVQANGEIQIPSEDGTAVYIFDGKGKHLRTLNSLTGTVRHRFVYDNLDRLTRIEDRYGNVTRIDRDAKGALTAIVAPGAQRSTLASDSNGYLASVANPAGETTRLT